MEEKKISLNDTIAELKDYKSKLKEMAENSEDVKNDKCSKEDELQEPAYLLYNQIAESTIGILQIPAVVNIFKTLSEKLDENTSKLLVELLSIVMTHSSHQAVLFYDELLKQELTKQFDHYGKHLNTCIADVNGIKSAIEVINKRISNIENSIKIEKFTKDNNITPDNSIK